MDIISTKGPCTHLSWCTAGECAQTHPVSPTTLLMAAQTVVLWCCSSGVGRTGALCLLYAALQELEAGNGIPELPLLVKKMRRQRKNMLQEKVGRLAVVVDTAGADS